MPDLILKAVTYRPTVPYTGDLSLSLLRLKNMILTGVDDLLYLQCYKGSLNLSETIATGALTGTIAGSLNGTTITGTGTAFLTQLRPGQFLFAGADLLVVKEVVSDTVFTIYRALTAAITAGTTGYRLPILFEINRKRGSMLQGNAHEYDKGNILGIGEGTFRINGTALNATMALTRKPRIAVYNAGAGTYTIYDLGMTTPSTAPTLADVVGGVKNMQVGHYSILLVPSRIELLGANNPGPKAEVNLGTAGHKIEVDVSAVGPDTTHGQTGWDVYVSAYSAAPDAGIQGPWFYLQTVTIASIVGNKFTVEWENSQVGRTGNEVNYDNDAPPDAAFLAELVGYPIWVGCFGKNGGTPGKSIVPAKPRNVDAAPTRWAVTSSPPEDILGVRAAQARLYTLHPKTLQQLQWTPIPSRPDIPPVTMRAYWQVGFANPYQLIFVNGMLIGQTTMGPTRSTEGVQDVVEQFDLGGYVADIMATWTHAHTMVEHDPDPAVNAVCFFHSADSKNNAGFWRTRVLIWGVRQQQWIGEVYLESDTRDMVVCGVAQVDGHLEFLAGGRYGAVRQVETATIVGSVTGAGTATAIVTAAGMTGSPKTITVNLALGDPPTSTATAMRGAMTADSDINSLFIVGGTGADIKLTKRLTAANDATLNIAINNGTCTGLTPAATSANTTAGVAGSVQVDTFRWNTVASGNVDYYAVWQFTNGGQDTQDNTTQAIQVTGKFTSGKAQIHGYSQAEAISLIDVENGTNSVSGDITLGSQSSPTTLERQEAKCTNLGLFTGRISGTWDSAGIPDRIDKVVIEFQPEGMPR